MADTNHDEHGIELTTEPRKTPGRLSRPLVVSPNDGRSSQDPRDAFAFRYQVPVAHPLKVLGVRIDPVILTGNCVHHMHLYPKATRQHRRSRQRQITARMTIMANHERRPAAQGR